MSRILGSALVVVVFVAAAGLVWFVVTPHAAPRPLVQPAMTTQQVYDDVCGHPDACKEMHDFLQYVEAQKRSMGLPPNPANPQPDDASAGR